ncbi:hypothetical protein ACJYFV_10070 [Enterobacter asburiae]|uniref:hypothetical protein n=1 Tax=Enterobacter asburiae TaxID=61645 RepID=UPI0018E976FC|nr:hypothetical protein [Enterobacter asburiae]MDI4538350.1 hypothetical protein [Escherichia coli]MBJ3793601.1 hypothetical protein [Enterobacter asburiae]HBM7610125.1 hypothetical protein [Enterobacter asburiae]HCM9298622.1 hypothetical protein [Enterobacter asburiae]HCR2100972.1 hypothetical protein [Enterobacter asburiae]
MKQKFIEWFTKNNNGCSPAMEDDRSFVYEMTQHMFEAYQAGVAEGEARCAALAAENAGLKESRKNLAEFIHEELDADYPLNMDIETPVTDVFLAEVRAQGVESFAESQKEYVRKNRNELDSMTRAAYCGSAVDAERFAALLRKGVQS